MSDTQQIIHCCFTDFDELTQTVRSWNLDFKKLDRGAFTGEIYQVISADFIFSYGSFGGQLKQEGESPRGYRTIGIPAVSPLEMIWRGHPVTESNLLVFPASGELHAYSDHRFQIFTLSISEELLYRWIDPKRFQSLEVVLCQPRQISAFRQLLHRIRLQGNGGLPVDRILHELSALLSPPETLWTSRSRPCRRVQTILRAEHHLMEYPDEPISVTTLSKAVGVSRRTLEYAFAAHLGVSPKTYINNIRLNGVRKVLRSGAVPKIADAANAQGFWHMGQFAKDYRRLFGELPSETVKASLS